MSLDLRAARERRLIPARRPHRLAPPLAAALLAITALPATAAPAKWSEHFAAESDTVVFFSADGALWKAPFSMASREELWTPSGRERLARLEVSPDGSRVAWITSGSEQDTVKLWIASSRPARPRALYFSFLPGQLGSVHFEPGAPTTSDANARGGRLVSASPRLLRAAACPMAWFPDGSSLAFGYSDGIALLHAEGGAAVPALDVPAVSLMCLDPAAVFVADLVRPAAPKEKGPQEGWYLLYPTGEHWRAFPAADLDIEAPWTASSTTVWWGKGSEVRAAHVHDPEPRAVAKMSGDVLGVVRHAASRSVWAASTNELIRIVDDAAEPERLASFPVQPVRRTIAFPAGGTFGVVAGDSLVLADGASQQLRRAALRGLDPRGMADFGGRLLLWGARTGSSDAAMAWLEPGESAVREVEIPAKKGEFVLSPGRKWLLLLRPGWKPATTLHAYDITGGTWSEVANPGIAGWEPLSPRE